MKKEVLSRHKGDATDPQGQSQDLRRPLTSPGPSSNGQSPGRASGEVRVAAAEVEDMDPTVKSKEEEGQGSREVHMEGDNQLSTPATWARYSTTTTTTTTTTMTTRTPEQS